MSSAIYTFQFSIQLTNDLTELEKIHMIIFLVHATKKKGGGGNVMLKVMYFNIIIGRCMC